MGFNAMFNSIGRAFGPSVGTYIMYTFHYNGLITWSLINCYHLPVSCIRLNHYTFHKTNYNGLQNVCYYKGIKYKNNS